ncbi:dephospho-CoA kinase [Candidatus Nanohalobium constans]|uniref:Dephospho-CoA kinase n=2 Tax=Candidatus Nanohalobium constans TaxID=2565781 RepID=A0A5Q0UH00_9ARCH|nr:dephospho-CoA kinase [Candidatus Nanohalobium constans]
MPLSGKTTVAEMLEDEGFAVLDMGEVVRIEMKEREIPTEQTGEFVNKMRELHGMDAIAQLSVPYLEEILEEKDKVVITGMRSWNEKQRFEEETGEEIDIIAVWTSRETRKERRKERQREEDQVGDEFHERDLREIENGVGKLMALSDKMIKNENINMSKLEEKVNDIVD